MRGLVSNTLLRNCAPRERPYEVRDTRLSGFLLRVQPTGVMTYYVEYARGRRYRLGRAPALKPEAARKRAQEILSLALAGQDPRQAKRQEAWTLQRFLAEEWAPWAEANIRSAEASLNRLRHSFAAFQELPLAAITPRLVEKWRTGRLERGTKPATVNRELADLRSCLSKAVVWGLLEQHPLAGVKLLRVDTKGPVRFLSREEESALRQALEAREVELRRGRASANAWRRARGYPELPVLSEAGFADHLRPMVLLSLNTGLRRGELFALRWGDVDLERALLTVRGATAKSSRTRHVPLNREAQAVLKRWAATADGSALVFPGRQGRPLDNVRKAWAGVLERAGIARFRWHDLRHSFASRLVMAGVDLNTVRELLGHASYAMTLRYAHLAPEHKAEAVARLMQENAHAVG